ncbi:Structural maintenance of chromosomes protein 2-2 [Camellia lanceoleosa]|uniref:Structural maintenance of chromosomes protein 2-2 n=1 Tax=Camellia lanceoleosa TaxID=1840588 RepID=A0ACC0H2F1_9ERIC|nr:Structural maintenance of chromosomes protein 2-2 [Camellia lanceoleosa]
MLIRMIHGRGGRGRAGVLGVEVGNRNQSVIVKKLIEKHAWITLEKHRFGRSGTDYDFASRDPHTAREDFEKLQAEQSECAVTLWYRAPEILLGSRHYSTPVDVWSRLYICLNGESRHCSSGLEIDELFKIFRFIIPEQHFFLLFSGKSCI